MSAKVFDWRAEDEVPVKMDSRTGEQPDRFSKAGQRSWEE